MIRPRAARTATARAGAVLAALAVASPAGADPLASKRAEAERVLTEIQVLDASVSKAVDDFSAARIRLQEIRAKQEDNRRRLAMAQARLRKAHAMLEARLLTLYTSEAPSALEILLGATTLDDLLARAETVGRVSEQDRRVVEATRSFAAEVRRRKAELAEARAEQ